MLRLSPTRLRHVLAQIKAYMGVIGDTHHPLHQNIDAAKEGNTACGLV